MAIRVFAAGSNVAIDNPVKSMRRETVKWKVSLGVMVWLSATAAQYTQDRDSYVPPPAQAKPKSYANAALIDNGRHWRPKDSGPVTVLQMVT